MLKVLQQMTMDEALTVGSLLTIKGNPKADKAIKHGYWEAVLHLLPGDGRCPNMTKSCYGGCINWQGNRVYYDSKMLGRAKRTHWFETDPDSFVAALLAEIGAFVARCRAKDLLPAVRLNATSDIDWALRYPVIFESFPDLQFFDYTKVPAIVSGSRPPNYHITFSRAENNESTSLYFLKNSQSNVAVVFGGCGRIQPLPSSFWGYPVLDGDIHDLRFLDPPDHVVGLRVKGSAAKQEPGFVVPTIQGVVQEMTIET